MTRPRNPSTDGDDVIFAGLGDDTIDSGAGADRISGGNGSDIFVLDNDTHVTTIIDFVSGVDQLVVRAFNFTDFTHFQSVLSRDGPDTLIAETNTTTTTAVLVGVMPNDLNAGDVII